MSELSLPEVLYARYADLTGSPPWSELSDKMRFIWRAAYSAADLERVRREGEKAPAVRGTGKLDPGKVTP